MSSIPARGRWYPAPAPALPGETDDTYTDRLTGADRTERQPYNHTRRRQCSIGWHTECTWWRELHAGATAGAADGCHCPCHTDTAPPADADYNQDAAAQISHLYSLPRRTGQRIAYLAKRAVDHDGVTTLIGLADSIGRAYGSTISEGFTIDVAWATNYHGRLDGCPPKPTRRRRG